MLPASWSAGAGPGVSLLDAWAVFAIGGSPWCSPNTAPTAVSRIAASPTMRIRCRIVVTSLGGQPGGTGAIAAVPPGSCVLALDLWLVWATGGRRWQRILPWRGHSGRPTPAHQPSDDQQGRKGDRDRPQGGGDDRVQGVA